MAEYALRFVLGGAIVSAFAVLGDVLRPKTFAGLFGAAPSVALATLSITIANKGVDYAAVQARSMALGAVALAIYSVLVCYLLMEARFRALPATLAALVAWATCAGGLHILLLGLQ